MLPKKVLVLFISLIAACSAFNSDDLGMQVSDPTELRISDIIRVVTNDIEDFRFRLTGITEQAVEGKDISIPLVEIRCIEVITPIRPSHDEVSETGRVFLVIITAAGLIMGGNSSSTYTSFDDVFHQ